MIITALGCVFIFIFLFIWLLIDSSQKKQVAAYKEKKDKINYAIAKENEKYNLRLNQVKKEIENISTRHPTKERNILDSATSFSIIKNEIFSGPKQMKGFSPRITANYDTIIAFESCGYSFVNEPSSSEMKLSLDIRGAPLSSYYIYNNWQNYQLWSGAKLAISLTYNVKGKKMTLLSLRNEILPSKQLLKSGKSIDAVPYGNPESAPFGDIYNNFKYIDRLLMAIYKNTDNISRIVKAAIEPKNEEIGKAAISILRKYNDEVAILTLVFIIEFNKSYSLNLPYHATNALIQMKDARSIKRLIDLLQDYNYNKNYSVRNSSKYSNALMVLEKITGQKYGYNYMKWNHWWSSQKSLPR